MEDMKKEIQKALSRPVCSGWDRGFLESVLSQLERGRQLSEKQLVATTKVVLRNGEEAQKIHYEWETIYNKEHKAEAHVLARYYKTTGYFSELTRDILADIVPDMRAYTKMRGNKYAQKVLGLEILRAEALVMHLHAPLKRRAASFCPWLMKFDRRPTVRKYTKFYQLGQQSLYL